MNVKELIDLLTKLDPSKTKQVKLDDGFCDLVDIQVSRTVDPDTNREVIVIEAKEEDQICDGDVLLPDDYME